VSLGEAVRSVLGGSLGFAAVDALVALTILALTFGIAFEALVSSRRIATAANETQRADTLLKFLLARASQPGEDETGRLSGFNWRLRTTYLPADSQAPGLYLCRRWAGATDGHTGRQYVLASVDFCAKPKTS
jgi:hypothetical protein